MDEPDHPSGRHLFRAYVDETGDRGTGPRSSRSFAMVAVILRDRNVDALDACLADIRDHRRGTRVFVPPQQSPDAAERATEVGARRSRR